MYENFMRPIIRNSYDNSTVIICPKLFRIFFVNLKTIFEKVLISEIFYDILVHGSCEIAVTTILTDTQMERWLSWSKAHDWKSCVG